MQKRTVTPKKVIETFEKQRTMLTEKTAEEVLDLLYLLGGIAVRQMKAQERKNIRKRKRLKKAFLCIKKYLIKLGRSKWLTGLESKKLGIFANNQTFA